MIHRVHFFSSKMSRALNNKVCPKGQVKIYLLIALAGQYPTFFLKGMHNRKVVDGYAVFVILLHTIQTVFNQYIKE